MDAIQEVISGAKSWHVAQTDALAGLKQLPDGVVNCVVTSPPYWQLRDYQTGHWEGGDASCDHSAAKRKTRYDYSLATSPIQDGDRTGTDGAKYKKSCPCGAKRIDQQIGMEETPDEFVAKLVGLFSEVRRVLRDDGLIWINLGDSYASKPSDPSREFGSVFAGRDMSGVYQSSTFDKSVGTGLSEGNLCGVPWKFALSMQASGWILRDVVVWAKPSTMPCSVAGWRWEQHRIRIKPSNRAEVHKTGIMAGHSHYMDVAKNERAAVQAAEGQFKDCPGCDKCSPNDGLVLRRGKWRCTPAWEPIFMFAKSKTYFSDGEPLKTRPSAATVQRDQYSRILDDGGEYAVQHDHETVCAGANRRNVWTIPHEALSEKHFAAYPSELVRLCLAGSLSEKGYCRCGKPWVRILKREASTPKGERGTSKVGEARTDDRSIHGVADWYENAPPTQTLGWRATCKCGTEPIGGLVLDMFTGSGRTGLQALRMGHRFIGLELSETYAKMARKLIELDSPLFNRTD